MQGVELSLPCARGGVNRVDGGIGILGGTSVGVLKNSRDFWGSRGRGSPLRSLVGVGVLVYGGGIGFGGSMGIKFACECSPHPSATHPPSPLEKAKGVNFAF